GRQSGYPASTATRSDEGMYIKSVLRPIERLVHPERSLILARRCGAGRQCLPDSAESRQRRGEMRHAGGTAIVVDWISLLNPRCCPSDLGRTLAHRLPGRPCHPSV